MPVTAPIRSVRPTIEDLLRSPEYLPSAVELTRRTVRFVRIAREDYRQRVFLENGSGDTEGSANVSLDALMEGLQRLHEPASVPSWIFHTGYCCSTLLARCFEHDAHVHVVKEPWILLDVAHATNAAIFLDPEDRLDILRLVIALLSRRFAGQSAVIIKPGALVNILFEDVMAVSAGVRCLLLYQDLEDHLCQVLKYPDRRTLARNRARLLAAEATRLFGTEHGYRDDLSDGQAAALVWQVWRRRFGDISRTAASTSTLLSMSAEEFLSAPISQYRRVRSHFCLGEGDAPSAPLTRHAKAVHRIYNPSVRQDDLRRAREDFAVELREALDWACGVGPAWFAPAVTAAS